MTPVTNISGGNRVGSRRGTRPRSGPRPSFILPAIATLASLIIWGVLVWVAVGFGADARGGESGAWVKLAIAAVFAVACLFLTFTFAGKAWRALTGSPTPPPADDYAGNHSNAYVEEQDYPGQAYSEQDYYGTGSYGYEDTGSYNRHSTDTGSQQQPYGSTGSRSAYTDTGSQSPYGYPTGDQGYGNTGSRAAYGASAYQPPTAPPPTPQPYYSNPSTPTSTPQSTSAYGSQEYTTDGYPAQQAGSPQYQSGSYQAPISYGQTGSRARLTQDPAATQAMPTQRSPQEPASEPDDEWPPRHGVRNKQWPPAEPDSPYRGRH